MIPALVALVACAPALPCGGTLDPTDPAFLYTDDVVPRFEITLDDDAWAALPTRALDNTGEDVHATFVYEDDTWDVGLHLKGSSSFSPIDDKPAMKIDFHQWVDDASFFGVRRLVLQNMRGDPSTLAEELAYTLYEWRGLPAARHSYACVAVNGVDYGLYGVLEAMDEQFLERAFADPDGNLYEGTFGADLRPHATDTFLLQEEGSPEPWDDLAVLADALDAATADTFLDALAAHFDLDALLDAWAIELVTGNIDGYISRGNNYLVYHEPGPDRWWMLPWGLDETFVEDTDVTDPVYEGGERDSHGVLFSRCAEAPDCVDAVYTHVDTLLDTWETGDLEGRARDLRGGLRALSRRDDRSPTGPIDTWTTQRRLVHWVAGRPADVRRQLGD